MVIYIWFFDGTIKCFPGWVRAFSIIGYSAAKFANVDKVTQSIFKTSNEFDTVNKDNNVLEILEYIYNNPSQMINEISLEFYDETDSQGKIVSKWEFWEKMNDAKLIKDSVYEDKNDVLKNKLINLNKLKDNVGYFFWYLFTGIIAILSSENLVYSVATKCNEVTLQDVEDKFNQETENIE